MKHCNVQKGQYISWYAAQIREQMSGPDLHVFTLEFLWIRRYIFKKKPGVSWLCFKWDHANLEAQIREQMSGPDLHVFTLKFLALEKPGFFSHFFGVNYATFQCGRYS